MNDIYIYNDDFISLLNLIDILIKSNIKPFNIKDNFYTATLLDNIINLDIPDNKNIINNFSNDILKTIYYVYLSSNDKKELIIFYFILNYYKYKDKVIYMKNLKCVFEATKIASYVLHENHKLKGFTRFKELNNNILYAEIEPTNNILPILSNHFSKRLANEIWIIHDIKRKILSIYDKQKYHIVSDEEFKLLDISESKNEMKIEAMWKEFYNTIGIKERKNDKCRMNFMPKKYWKHIIEMSDKL